MSLQSNQRKALEAITAGATIEQAAAIADVTETTVYRWRSENANGFMDALQEANERILADTVTALTVASVQAVQILIEVASDEESPASVRVSAAKAILDSTIKVRELYDIERRISELENRLAS